MRIVSWNIRAGGGRRVEVIARQIDDWNADVVMLSEFRGTPPSLALARGLAARGLSHQVSTADRAAAATNALLVASRWPLRRIRRQRRQLPARDQPGGALSDAEPSHLFAVEPENARDHPPIA